MPRPIQSIQRAAQVMHLLSGRARRLSLVELSAQMGLPKGTVFGILRTLQQVGFVEKDPDSAKYQLGAALLHFGSTYLDGNELRSRALNWADSLAARSNEAVRIGTLHDGRVLVVHHVFRPDDSYQVLQVGSLLPLHATGMGKALLADNGELVDGEGSVAAPITDRSERTVGAIAISGPVERLCDAELPRSDLVAYVRESARAISRDLGAIPW